MECFLVFKKEIGGFLVCILPIIFCIEFFYLIFFWFSFLYRTEPKCEFELGNYVLIL
jgi:hypothetical protein